METKVTETKVKEQKVISLVEKIVMSGINDIFPLPEVSSTELVSQGASRLDTAYLLAEFTEAIHYAELEKASVYVSDAHRAVQKRIQSMVCSAVMRYDEYKLSGVLSYDKNIGYDVVWEYKLGNDISLKLLYIKNSGLIVTEFVYVCVKCGTPVVYQSVHNTMDIYNALKSANELGYICKECAAKTA